MGSLIRRIQPSWIIGILGAVIGAGIGIYISRTATGNGYELLPFTAGLAALTCTTSLWWLILDRPKKYTPIRGAVAGGLAGASAHYLCWFFIILAMNVCYLGWGGCVSSLGEPPANPIFGLWGAAVMSLWSLLFFGWLTVPIGALIAAGYAAWLGNRISHRSKVELSM